MNGSEKQATWATQIRTSALKTLGHAYASELSEHDRTVYTAVAMTIDDPRWWIKRDREVGSVSKVKRALWNVMTAEQRAQLGA